MSADVYAPNLFKCGFKKEKDYDLDFVYNADETGLNWKSLRLKIFSFPARECNPKQIKNIRVPLIYRNYG